MTTEDLIAELQSTLSAKDQAIHERDETISQMNTTIAGLQANGNGTVPGPVHAEVVAERDALRAKVAAGLAALQDAPTV